MNEPRDPVDKNQAHDLAKIQEQHSIEARELSKEIKKLNQEIESLGDETKLRKEQMELLHKYNDVKDATQTIIGRLADAETVTFKSIHKDYDLPMND